MHTSFSHDRPARAPRSPVVLFLTGPAACGKTTLAEAWVRHRLQQGDAWTLLDKDVVGGQHGPRLLEALGADPNDRDSPLFKKEVRDLDYRATLQLAAAQLALGGSVALPGPWTRELVDGLLAEPLRLGLPAVRSVVVWLSLSDRTRRRRIEERGHPLDRWKLAHWEAYCKGSCDGAPPACMGALPAILQAEAPLAEQLAVLAELVDGRQLRAGTEASLLEPEFGIGRRFAAAPVPA